ncbi:MAG: hypothetical protein ACRCTQ_06935 [Brevinemataceae bacterium]
MLRIYYGIGFILLFVPPVFCQGVYSVYEKGMLQYQANFKGTVIIENQFLSYTNNAACLSFDYYIANKNLDSVQNQTVIDIKLSRLRKHNLPSVFENIWDVFINNIFKDVAYMVMLSDGKMLVFNKSGQVIPAGQFLGILFPPMNLQDKIYEFSEQGTVGFGLKNSPHNVRFNTKGWDFFSNLSIDNPPCPMVDTNTIFIENLYRCYSKSKKSSPHNIFWFQKFLFYLYNTAEVSIAHTLWNGAYVFNHNTKKLEKAVILSDIKTTVPYSEFGFEIPVNFLIKGQWQLQLKK